MQRRILLCGALTGAMMLSGCGEGDTFVASTPTPPAPTPTPTPTPAPLGFKNMAVFSGVSTNTNFTTRGYDTLYAPEPSSPFTGDFTISYDAASKSYSIASTAISGRFDEFLPTSDPTVITSDATRLIGQVRNPATGYNNGSLTVYRPATDGSIGLTYSTYAIMRETQSDGLLYVAFGFPTLSANIPTTGNATYLAKTSGRTDNGLYAVDGDVRLDFNFGGGTLSGYFDPKLLGRGTDTSLVHLSLGHYAFSNAVYSSGAGTFSGSFALPPGVTGYSAFDGQLTGPAAQELIARFQAPYTPPMGATGDPGRIFGVWIGAKQ